jgi:hypothetical protein
MDRIKLAQDRGQCQAVVKTVMNLRVSSNAWLTEELLDYL